ncbi:transglycosylase SLT domain-containing protein [Coleofasciculus sp. FACHB-712]|uniref:lytic transglycosylase domain-containing protein n=1 Tax=Coleofasciculus sp. FACHB-712 TaxID=2692789 RepID=UPI001684EEA8|nr:transglycosylase SLT domain-containing protein [Coleofasciculus sp. FACHB-712]MBD1943055.1 transglycosylase SLT domain-containing protein [Coleofasciculus sp. FACHB-712]
MLKLAQKNKILLSVGAGLLALVAGATLSVPQLTSWLEKLTPNGQSPDKTLLNPGSQSKNSVLPLASLPAAQRVAQLEAIANGTPSPERNRARYLLANDSLQQQQPKKAIASLEGLEADYPVLAPYIALKRAQAYQLAGDKAKATAAWQNLLESYPDNPVAAEALFVLGQTNPKYREQAIAQFKSHPRTLEIVRSSLSKNPNQPRLLLHLAKNAPGDPGILPILDRLVTSHEAALKQQGTGLLKPEDWQAIAYSYWENGQYRKAGQAYAKAPRTSLHAYRIGRGLHLGEKRTEAKIAYQQMIQQFPDAKETGLALRRLASLSSQPPEAIAYLDLVIRKFPDEAGEALLAKAEILDRLNSDKSAAEARQLLLTKYGSSDVAAEYRWKVAQAKATLGDFLGAWQWAQPIANQNPDHILAPRAGFWVGKWAAKLGRQQDAKAAYEHVLAKYPQSYYAWRSAVLLGWDVGDFTTVRQLSPQVVRPDEHPILPAGSETLKELYQLGQKWDAWTLWQAEFQNRMQPTVAEQFTNGIMQVGLGNHLKGMNLVSTLEDRETPEEQAEYKAIRKQPVYWHTLYPFPFLEIIENWSQQRQLNPLLVTALIRQESRFEPKIRSVAGAVGLMQVMPGTGKWVADKIGVKQFNTENPNDNVKLGTWFLDFTHKEYNNNSLLAVASYNAGPGNVSKWLKEKGPSIDPDEFVEEIPFEETKGYVRQVFGNYWNYLRLYNPQVAQLVAKYSDGQPTALKN